MHELRSAILTGDVRSIQNPVAHKEEKCRRKRAEPTLVDIPIAREERRVTDQRREDRFQGVVERATIVVRGKKTLASVVNVSGCGAMIESHIVPRIGERIELLFEGFDAIEGVVCWVKQGRIGLDLGEDAIDLG